MQITATQVLMQITATQVLMQITAKQVLMQITQSACIFLYRNARNIITLPAPHVLRWLSLHRGLGAFLQPQRARLAGGGRSASVHQ